MNNNQIETLVKKIKDKANNKEDYSRELNDLIIELDSSIKAIIREKFHDIDSIFDDLLQEGRISIEKAVLGYNFDKNIKFSTFASHCVENAIMDYLRRQNSNKNKAYKDSISISTIKEDLHPGDYKTPEDIVIEKEALAEISSKLSEFEKKVIELYSQNYSYKEIANILNKTPKDIDNCIQKIRRKL